MTVHEGLPIVILEGKSVGGKDLGGERQEIPGPMKLYHKIIIIKNISLLKNPTVSLISNIHKM